MSPAQITMETSLRKRWIPVAGNYMPPEEFVFVEGKEASLKFPSKKPVFYARIEPSLFTLVNFGIKKERRYIVFSRKQSNRIIPFDSEALNNGLFKITPKGNLENGEYGFLTKNQPTSNDTFSNLIALSGAYVKVYDFSIKFSGSDDEAIIMYNNVSPTKGLKELDNKEMN